MPLLKTYHHLFEHYGRQHWWPGDTAFEVMVGSVLTQNTAWTNVEKAIANLKGANLLDAEKIIKTPHNRLAMLLRPSGYFNIKAKRLRNFCEWYVKHGGWEALSHWPTEKLRQSVLSVNGIGPETADDIVLYAFHRPVFVIDAYTRRLFARLGVVSGEEDYETLRALFEEKLKGLPPKKRTQLFNEYHALIVRHAKEVCKKKPLCEACCVRQACKGCVV
jgi:endonuclease-3 related protein